MRTTARCENSAETVARSERGMVAVSAVEGNEVLGEEDVAQDHARPFLQRASDRCGVAHGIDLGVGRPASTKRSTLVLSKGYCRRC